MKKTFITFATILAISFCISGCHSSSYDYDPTAEHDSAIEESPQMQKAKDEKTKKYFDQKFEDAYRAEEEMYGK